MKVLCLFFAFVISFPAISSSKDLEAKKYYYSALNEFFIETYSRKIKGEDLDKLEELLFFTGIEILEDYDAKMLEKFPTSSTRFILGRKALLSNKNEKAIELFNLIHPDHRYYPEAKLLQAQIYAEKSQGNLEKEAYEQCLKSAEKNESAATSEKIKRYYRMSYEICLVNKARHLYKNGNYQESIDAYNKVPKQSYKWPYLLLEKAWVYYQMGDYNRTLGLLVTYKSPLMDTYFFPEAEYLAALTYFKLCLWEDSMIIVNQYYEFYRPRFGALEEVLKKNMSSQSYFYELMFGKKEELKDHEEFVHHMITRLKKQIRFSLDFNTIHKIEKEMKDIYKNEPASSHKELLSHLASVRENMVTKINYNAKKEIFKFLETVPLYSSELFKLNLEVISRKKDLVYNNDKLVSERGRGDYSNVKRSRFEQFWKFHGAFWADELGDYSLGLKSNCEVIKIQPEVEE